MTIIIILQHNLFYYFILLKIFWKISMFFFIIQDCLQLRDLPKLTFGKSNKKIKI